MLQTINSLFNQAVTLDRNIITGSYSRSEAANQVQTGDIFGDKWSEVDKTTGVKEYNQFQRDWFLKLYGFDNEEDFGRFLKDKKVIIDAGCGLGDKTAWMATLAPESTVIGIDFSEAAFIAARNHQELKNAFFMRGDIARTGLLPETVDFVLCDQVIMHTEDPELTFAHLADLTSKGGVFACYVYAKKAMPREMIDDYFRSATHSISKEDMWKFSEQVTELGKRLSDLKVSFEAPAIDLLGIKAGEYDIQRFIYWNFLKCFWREDIGFDMCKTINYDWYAPSNARRYSREEFEAMIKGNGLTIDYFYQEEPCFSGRFRKNS